MRFIRDFIQIAVYELTEEVDQIVWNEVSGSRLSDSPKLFCGTSALCQD